MTTFLAEEQRTEFDIRRAEVREIFPPLRAGRLRPLAERLQDGLLADEPLLVLARPSGVIALSTTELSYYHVAQGELAGEPWLVTF